MRLQIVEIVDELAPRSMLPAIYFVFSRAGCDDAANAVVSAGVRLTDQDEQDEIRTRAEALAGPRPAFQDEVRVPDFPVRGFRPTGR